MPKNICLIYVETNGVHKTDEIVSKKNNQLLILKISKNN